MEATPSRVCSSRWWSSRPAAASAPTTSIRACSRTTSSSSGPPIDDMLANLVIAQLLFLEAEDPDKDIYDLHQLARRVGHRRAGDLRHDAASSSPTSARICVGQAASMAAVLLAGGRQGQAFRAAELPDHDPPAVGRRAGPGVGHRRSRRRRSCGCARTLNQILTEHTGQPLERIERDTRPRLHHDRRRRPRTTASSTT